MTLFNWNELRINGNYDFDQIITLAYSLSIGYEKRIAYNNQYLFKLLYINSLNRKLFARRYIHSGNNGITSLYKCKEPLSHFRNNKFLIAKCKPVYKVLYLFMLGHRAYNDYKTYIPLDYIDEKYWFNPFTYIKDNKIHFIMEKENLQ